MFENKYPYTDFSQLNLDWFLNKFKDLLAEQQRVSGRVQDLDETVQQFTTFVTNYFDDLDVQQEINNKLDAMVADGTLSALIAPLVGDDIQDSVTEWLNENVDPVGSAVVVDSSLSITGAAADAKVTGDDIGAINTTLNKLIEIYIEDGAAQSSVYYKKVTALNVNKKYAFDVTADASGTFKLEAGTTLSTSSMVDTIYEGAFEALVTKHISGYVPTGAYQYLRLSIASTGSWTVKVYEVYDNLAQIVSKNTSDISNAPVYKEISAADFVNAPYNSYIGNLDNGSIVRVTASYNALDYPQNKATTYTIITYGTPGNPCQIALSGNGLLFSRYKQAGGWSDWVTNNGIYTSNVVVASGSPYTDFNDFPVGSIVRVDTSNTLDNSPPGFNTIGHAELLPGPINAVCITYSETWYSPTYLCQICLIYRSLPAGDPRIAFRICTTIGGVKTWSAWSTLSEDGSLHATNKVVDINSYSTLTFDDFDDAPINTIYQVDYNVGSTIAHNPAPGKSGVLMTYAFSVSTRHGLVQTHFAFDNTPGTASMYFRYGFQQAPDVYAWTPWEKVNTTTQS